MAELAGEREVVLARELTKMHEEVLRGRPGDVLEQLAQAPRGEFVGVLAPVPELQREEEPSAERMAREVQELLGEGVGRSDAFKLIATHWGVPKRAVYDAFLELRRSDS
jgi:16S rRNA (cytidine1402-2'-O)-methyltransferase